MEILKGQEMTYLDMIDYDAVELDPYADLREVYYSDTLVEGMYIRVVIKDTEKPRITIRKEGATIKVPSKFEEFWIDCVKSSMPWCNLYQTNGCSTSVRGRFHFAEEQNEQKLFINFSAVEKNKITKGKV